MPKARIPSPSALTAKRLRRLTHRDVWKMEVHHGQVHPGSG